MTNGRFTHRIALGFLGCLAGIALGAPMAHAGFVDIYAQARDYSANALYGCQGAGAIFNGGDGFASASVPLTPCSYTNPLGSIEDASVSASGSWITGDFSVFAQAATNPNANNIPSIEAIGEDDFYDDGIVTLPSGITSAKVTFGVTGLSGKSNYGDTGASSVSDFVELGFNGAQSVACSDLIAINSSCPNGGLGYGLAGELAPISMTVSNDEALDLSVTVEVTAYASNYGEAQGSISVDPLYLTLPPGVTFDSGATNFLSGPPVPELPIWAMMLAGFAGLGLAGYRASRKAAVFAA